MNKSLSFDDASPLPERMEDLMGFVSPSIPRKEKIIVRKNRECEEIFQLFPSWQEVGISAWIRQANDPENEMRIGYVLSCSLEILLLDTEDPVWIDSEEEFFLSTYFWKHDETANLTPRYCNFSNAEDFKEDLCFQLARSALATCRLSLYWNVETKEVWAETHPPYSLKKISTRGEKLPQ